MKELVRVEPNGDICAFRKSGKVFLRLEAQPRIMTAAGLRNLKIEASAPGRETMTLRGEDDKVIFERLVSFTAGTLHVLSSLMLKDDMEIVSFYDAMTATIPEPRYVWTPNLCPESGDVVGDHAFRSPMVVLQDEEASMALIPDLDVLGPQRFSTVGLNDWQWTGAGKPNGVQIPMFMSMIKESDGARRVEVGLADYSCRPHVYYNLTGKAIAFPRGKTFRIGYDLLLSSGTVEPYEIGQYMRFLWEKYARRYTGSALPQKLPFDDYSRISYHSSLAYGDMPEFETADGKAVTGVRTTSSRAARDVAASYFKLPPRSVWFSAWFNSFRTAFGMRYYGERMGADGETLSAKATGIKDLLLGAPDYTGGGLIPQVYDYEGRQWWCGVPRLTAAGRDVFDCTASAHTAQWMVLWDRYLEREPRLMERAARLADYMMKVQDSNGAFPGYIDRKGQPLERLRHSGHSGMVSLFLCELYESVREARLLDAIERACRFYISEVIPTSRYHDFETFYSCSQKELDFYDARTGQHAQNNLSLVWITETLLRAYAFTGNKEYLKWGRRCLDQLSLYQQVWNPTFLKLYAFGGFCCMNTDGEWNDMRQPQYSAVYFRGYLLTGEREYFERAVAALRAGYANYCHPLHRDTNPVRYDAFPDGLMPENYAHSGEEGHFHRSGFDWGGGALGTMTALCDILYGDIFVDADNACAFGINGCTVSRAEFGPNGIALTLEEQTATARNMDIVLRHNGKFRRTTIKVGASEERRLNWTSEAILKTAPYAPSAGNRK